MNDEAKHKLLVAWISREITEDQFINQYKALTNQSIIDDKYCLQLINLASNEKDDEKLEEAFILGFTIDCFSKDFSQIFCKLLQEDWHYKHEDIARVLQSLKDPSTVDCLYTAAELQFDYLDYDDTCQFARKCSKALSDIDNATAISKLQLLAQSNFSEIKQYAIKELKYKGLL